MTPKEKSEILANNFRKELIELLIKHNAEISIDNYCDGGSIDMNFDIKNSNGEFVVADAWLASTINGIITVKDIERTIQLEY